VRQLARLFVRIELGGTQLLLRLVGTDAITVFSLELAEYGDSSFPLYNMAAAI
jgi:hypothetical protein